MKKGKHPYAR
jgi:protein farnesyltransferase/geranylgeranyltransferase type-1 subunit alpha